MPAMRTSCACSCPARAARAICSRSPCAKERRCATCGRACRRSKTCLRRRSGKIDVLRSPFSVLRSPFGEWRTKNGEPRTENGERLLPIHDQGYRRYGGGKTPHGQAWTVIAKAGIRTMLSKRTFLGLLLLAWFPFVLRAIQIYASA